MSFCWSCKAKCMSCFGGGCCLTFRDLRKKKLMFFVVISAVIFSAVLAIVSSAYLQMIQDEWINANCNVTRVEWKDDLYNIYFPEEKDAYVPTKIGTKNDTIIQRLNENSQNFNAVPWVNKTRIKVKGWLYFVEVYYKNMLFNDIIRDPSSSNVVAPLYETGGIYDCISLVERLKPENAFVNEEEMETIDKNASSIEVFFIVTTQWPTVDTVASNHRAEKLVRVFIVMLSLLMLLIFSICLKIYYEHYSAERNTYKSPYEA